MIQSKEPAGIYIHIPFCLKKCNYCAFLSGTSTEAERETYVEALLREIRLRKREVSLADTLYFGGGTPSLLTAEQIRRIIEGVKESFDLTSDAEITLEANPATLTREKLEGYRAAGVNRLSMGVQSMDDRRLQYLGRIHTAEDAVKEFRMARATGFDNINLDLIFAVPGTHLSDVMEDLQEVTALQPEHISFYSLQLEEGTPFFRKFEEGSLTEVPDDEDREMYHQGCRFLASQGYEHYEISNFAKPGRASRHNSKYWSMTEYVGLGLGASSYVNHCRMENLSDMKEYLEAVRSGQKPFETMYSNSERDDVAEAVFTGLRRREGIQFRDILGSQEEFFRYYAEEKGEILGFCEGGYLEVTDDGMRLTEKGIDISNRIMALFV